MNKNKILAACAAMFAIASISGCSDNDDPVAASSFTPHTRVDPIAAQTATISIADPAGTPVVTVTSMPADMGIDAEATAVDANNVDVAFTVTNNAGRLLFGGKVVVNTISDSTVTNAATASGDGTTNDTSEEFASLGLYAIEDGATGENENMMRFTDLDGLDDPLVIDVTIPTEEVMAYGSSSTNGDIEYEIQDVNGAIEIEDADIANFANYSPGASGLVDGVTSQDGRYIYYASRNSLHLFVLDTVTLQTDGILVSDGEVRQGNVGGVVMTADGNYLYVGYTTGVHRYCYAYGTDTKAYVAKIDLGNNSVVSSVEVPIDASNYYATTIKDIAMSGDESLLAVSAWTACASDEGAPIYTVTTSDMQVSDRVLSASDAPRYLALDEDGSNVYYVSRDDEARINVIEVATGEWSEITLTNTSTDAPRYLGFGPDGRLYYLRQDSTDGLAVLDLAVSTTDTVIDTSGTPYGLSFDLDGDKYYINESSGTSTWDITNDTEMQAASGLDNVARHSYVTSAY